MYVLIFDHTYYGLSILSHHKYTSGTVHKWKQVSNTGKVTLDCGLTANPVNTYRK